jgi:hypothetical protein
MIKKSIKYTDYAGKEQVGEFYFNMSKGELVLLEMSAVDENTEGMNDKLNRLIASRNGKEIADTFKEIVDLAYGERTVDGTRFQKEDENGKSLAIRFRSTGAYSELIYELATDADKGAEFINGLMPQNLRDEVNKEVSNLSARERSEAQMTGFKQKEEPSVVKLPELPASEPILEKPAPVEEDFSQMSKEELLAKLQG